MKSVTGKLVSTKTISLANAAKYISRFTSSNNGTSHALGVYLQRAAESFSRLVQVQKKLKWSRLDDAKAKALALEKNKNLESKGKGSKNQGFELKKNVPSEIKGDEVEIRRSSENKGQEGKNEIFEVKNEETLLQIGQNPDRAVEIEKKKKKKSGKEKVQKDGAVMIEQAVGVVFEWSKNLGSKGKGKENYKFDVKNDLTLQIEQTTEGLVEEKKKSEKNSGKGKGKNDETAHVQRGLDGVDGDEKVFDEGGEKSKQESAEAEGGSVKSEKKKKRKKSEEAEGKVRSKGEDGKKAADRKVDGGETVDLSEQSGKKKKRKGREADGGETMDLTEQAGKMTKRGKIEGETGRVNSKF